MVENKKETILKRLVDAAQIEYKMG